MTGPGGRRGLVVRPGALDLGPSLPGRVVVAVLLLAAPVIGAVLFWGSWGWMALSAAVAVVELATLRRSQRFSSRVWRSVRVGRRSGREQSVETVYVVAAVAGVVLLIIAVVRAI